MGKLYNFDLYNKKGLLDEELFLLKELINPYNKKTKEYEKVYSPWMTCKFAKGNYCFFFSRDVEIFDKMERMEAEYFECNGIDRKYIPDLCGCYVILFPSKKVKKYFLFKNSDEFKNAILKKVNEKRVNNPFVFVEI